MSIPILSRAYLQGIPEMRRQEYIDKILQLCINNVLREAELGKTNYIYEPPNHNNPRVKQVPPPPTVTTEELVLGLQKKFPDCFVAYQEVWEVVTTNQKILKKGIVIDWS